MFRNTAVGSREVTKQHLDLPNRPLSITALVDAQLLVNCADLP